MNKTFSIHIKIFQYLKANKISTILLIFFELTNQCERISEDFYELPTICTLKNYFIDNFLEKQKKIATETRNVRDYLQRG